jgi:hypothetical protein
MHTLQQDNYYIVGKTTSFKSSSHRFPNTGTVVTSLGISSSLLSMTLPLPNKQMLRCNAIRSLEICHLVRVARL